MADRVRLVVYSDYLCPWCYNAAVRLHRVEEEFDGRLELRWRAYLLRPERREKRDLERFVRYTQSWLRPAAEADSGSFRVWESTAGPPSHSVPPQVIAKAAARLGPEPFASIHRRLLEAYFRDNRDISDAETLAAIWREAGLEAAGMPAPDDPALVAEVRGDHAGALALGMNGVPAAHLEGNDAFVLGAQPLESYRRWVARQLD